MTTNLKTDTARRAYFEHTSRATAALEQIQQDLLDRRASDDPSWGDVGDAAALAYELSQLRDRLLGIGEYATTTNDR